MWMVKAAAGAQSADGVEQRLVGIGGGPNHELNRHPRRPAGMQRVSWLTVRLSLPLLDNQRSDPVVVFNVVAKLFSGAICARLLPQGVSKLSEMRLASEVSRSI